MGAAPRIKKDDKNRFGIKFSTGQTGSVMKKIYESPMIIVKTIETQDVIATSGKFDVKQDDIEWEDG